MNLFLQGMTYNSITAQELTKDGVLDAGRQDQVEHLHGQEASSQTRSAGGDALLAEILHGRLPDQEDKNQRG